MQFCRNCGKDNHVVTHCKNPITSIGVVPFRINAENAIEYLMVRRNRTYEYIDFISGHYDPLRPRSFFVGLFSRMTVQEKANIRNYLLIRPEDDASNDFELYDTLYVSPDSATFTRYKNTAAKEKFLAKTDILSILDETDETFPPRDEAEWGFPKGRRKKDVREMDYKCAMREFMEETGYAGKNQAIENIRPFEEIFIGSDNKSYVDRFYVLFVADEVSMEGFQRNEISAMEWKTFGESLATIRDYNLEKKQMITDVDRCIRLFELSRIAK